LQQAPKVQLVVEATSRPIKTHPTSPAHRSSVRLKWKQNFSGMCGSFVYWYR